VTLAVTTVESLEMAARLRKASEVLRAWALLLKSSNALLTVCIAAP